MGDVLSTKLFYTEIKNDGFQKNTFLGSDGPEKDYQNVGAAFLFEAGESFEALLTVETYDDNSDIGVARNANTPGFFVCDVLGDCASDNRNDTDYRTETNNPAQYDTDAVTLTMKYDINEQLQLVSVTGWRDETEDYFSDLDGSFIEFLGIDNDNLHEQKSTELRLEGVYENFDFVLGAYIWENEYEQNWITFGSFWDSIVPGLSTNAPWCTWVRFDGSLPAGSTWRIALLPGRRIWLRGLGRKLYAESSPEPGGQLGSVVLARQL